MIRLVITVLLIGLLASCQTDSVENFVQERVLSSNMDAASFRVQSVQTSAEGTLVLYSARDGLNPNYQHMGFAILQKGLTGWKTGMIGSRGQDMSLLKDQVVDFATVDISYETSLGLNPLFTHQLVYGEVLGPAQATAIQAVASDGSIIENEGTPLLFAFVAPKPGYICALRVLDAQQQVLEVITPTNSEGRLPGADCDIET